MYYVHDDADEKKKRREVITPIIDIIMYKII